MARYSADALRTLLCKRKMATLDELKEALGTDVNMTVFRKLAELSYRTSYSHGGRYYTLNELAEFDELGLWSHRSVWFSRYGTLLATLEALVSEAEAGYFAHELRDCLHVEVKGALLRLATDGRVARERVAGLYLYCSSDESVRTRQVARRQARAQSSAPGEPKADRTVLTDEVKAAIVLFFSLLDEQQRRLFAGLEALQFAAQDQWIADFLGVHVETVSKGREDLIEGRVLLGRVRRPGGGRKPKEKKARRSSRRSKS